MHHGNGLDVNSNSSSNPNPYNYHHTSSKRWYEIFCIKYGFMLKTTVPQAWISCGIIFIVRLEDQGN